MRFLLPLVTTVLAALLPLGTSSAMDMPSFHTKGTATNKPTGPLKPGEYWWLPQLSPTGPVTILVSIPNQMMHVYRNGVLIGRSTVSTGSKGHSTPGGVFTILEKQKTHRSSTYDNAPMPNMQRLTWSGIAMHSGNLPGYPASHGCVRLPYDFSKLLFPITERGGTVVIGDSKKSQPYLASDPGLMLAPKDFDRSMLAEQSKNEYDWRPERSTAGPITIVISSADKTMYVYRNGTPIGRAAVDIAAGGFLGTRKDLGNHVFTLLDGATNTPSRWAPGHTARRWAGTTVSGPKQDADDIGKRLAFNPEFASKLDDVLTPGATVIVTDLPAVRDAVRGKVLEH